MYIILLGLQVIIVALILRFSVGSITASAAIAFRPINWVILFFLLAFIFPQFFIFLNDMSVLGLEHLNIKERTDAVISVQAYLLFSLIVMLVGYFFLLSIIKIKRGGVGESGGLPSNNIIIFLFYFIGLFASVYLLGQDISDGRSTLVKTPIGKIAYAASFFFTYTTLYIIAQKCECKKYISAFFFASIMFSILIPLGGRGRVLWPLVEVFVYILIVRGVQLNALKLLIYFSMSFVLLQMLDPIIFIIQGADFDNAFDYFLAALNISELFMKRTFEGFHNLAVIISLDEIPHNIKYLTGGSGEAFMSMYFSDAYSRGVGFPATLFGELWLSGGVPILLLGSLIFGGFVAFIEKLYFSLCCKRVNLIFYLNIMPWLSLIGGAYIDQSMKVMSVIIASFVVNFFLRSRLRS